MSQAGLNWSALPLLLTAEEAGEVLRVHVNTVKALCRSGGLPAIKVGREWRINRTDLLKHLHVPDDGEASSAALAPALSAADFRLFADFARDWEFWLAPDGYFRYVSPSCERISGYTPAEFTGSSQLFFEIVAEGDRPSVEAAIERALTGGTEEGLDYRITTREGKLRWVSLAFQSIYSPSGPCLGARGSIRDSVNHDIAERKRAEEALLLSRRQLQALSHRLVEVQEEERRSLSRELHDEAGQLMTALKIGLGVLRRDAGCSDEMRHKIGELRVIADDASESLHRLALNLRPSSLDRYGLVPALEGYIDSFQRQTGIEVVFVGDTREQRLPPGMETALYRLVQESLTNVARHAQATQVGVVLQRESEGVLLIVEDDGIGFDVEEALQRGRLGLLGMRERAEMLGGTLTIESRRGGGTTLYVSLPIGRADLDAGQSVSARGLQMMSAITGEQVQSGHTLPEAELARARALADVLNDLHEEIALLGDPDLILQRALRRAGDALESEDGVVAGRDDDAWVLRYGYRLGPEAIGRRYRAEEIPGYLSYVAATGQVLVIDDTHHDPRISAAEAVRFEIAAVLAVPIVLDGEVAWVLGLNEHSRPRHFTPAEVQFAERLKTSLSLSMENARLRKIERRQREDMERWASELEAVLAGIADGLVIYDERGGIVRMNRAAMDLLSYSGPEADVELADRVRRVRPEGPDGRPYQLSELPATRALSGETVRGVVMALHSAGGTRWVSASAAPIPGPEGVPTAVVATFTDITPLHDMQQELEATYQELEVASEAVSAQTEELAELNARLTEERDRLQALLHNIPDEVWFCDADGNFTLANAAAVHGLGFDKPGLAFQSVPEWTELEILNPDGVPRPLDETPLLRSLRGEVVRYAEEIVRNLRTGELRYRRASSAPVRDQEGRIVGAVAVVRDITESKDRAEELDARVQERTAQLLAANASLTALSRRLVETQERERRYVADQLYNEAGQVLAALQIQLFVPDDDESAASGLEETRALIGRVMGELHALATRLRPVALDRLGLATAVRQYAEEWGRAQGVDVQFEAAGVSGLRLSGEAETAVFRVVQEALINIAQHAAAHAVTVTLNQAGGRLSVVIEDDGAGIDLGAVAERGAMGLLSMRERIEAVGGQFLVETSPGKGTRIAVRVPGPFAPPPDGSASRGEA